MPGVPSGRACDACRKQKKKCDEKQPTCSRCLRLKLKCVGSGQQRYKFQEEKRFARPKKQKVNTGKDWAVASIQCHSAPSQIIAPATTKLQHMYIHVPPGTLAAGPSNELTSLTSAFLKTIKRSTDLRYNLWWSFGSYLEDVPCRLGTNEALDRAVDALTTLHMDFCTGRPVSVEALSKYAQALRTMRVYLDDKVHAQSSNTLCAVMVLLVCQMFMGQTNQCWSGHAEGAALILKARKNFGPRDEFETKLFLSLRGCVLFEGLYNDRINLTPTEWTDLVTNDLDANTPDGQMLYYLSRAPELIRRGRESLHTGTDTTAIRDEIRSLYQTCKHTLSALHRRSTENDNSTVDTSNMNTAERALTSQLMYSHYQRTYGIGLVVTLYFNCMLGALGGSDGATAFDASYLSKEVLALAERSATCRPIGSGYLLICFTVAWGATTDPLLRERLLDAMNDYNSDFGIRDTTYLLRELEWSAEHLRLGTPFRVWGES